VLTAAELLSSAGVEATVAIVSGFNPDPARDIAELLAGFRFAVSVEAQVISGGLGSFISTVIATEGLACRLRILAVRESPDGTSGGQTERWRKYGLDRASIVRAALETTGRNPQ
jgi:transketolase C-terminal domain/subunit